MNELSLFTGVGGGVLGTMLLGFRHIGYVECDNYCQKVLAQRIEDGILDPAPIFGDVRAFVREGYAASYTGMVDVLTAGFPCQPFSVAGKRLGADDERNMWPTTADVIRVVRPRFVLLENVPGIRAYLPVVIRDLRRLGYSVRRPLQLGADDVGAPHRRKRVWMLAHDASQPDRQHNAREGEGQVQQSGISDCPAALADAFCTEWRAHNETGGCSGKGENSKRQTSGGIGKCGEDVADATGGIRQRKTQGQAGHVAQRGENMADAIAIRSIWRIPISGEKKSGRAYPKIARRGRWPTEPNVGRVAHGVASRLDRLKAIGNGQVPRVVATAWRILVKWVRSTRRG